MAEERAYATGMKSDDPWVNYSRDRLPHGWSYPLGQQDFLLALQPLEVKVRTLSLSWLETKPSEPLYLLTADWFSDVRPNYFGIEERDAEPLRIIHHAVPSPLRQEMRDTLTNGQLHTMVEWLRMATAQGNAWTASDHHWHLIRTVDGNIKAHKA